MDEATAQILSFIGQERINCVYRKQLAEDHLAHMYLMLRKAETALRVGMERAGFAAPGSKEAVKHFVGERIVEGRLPNNCATVKAVLIPLRSSM